MIPERSAGPLTPSGKPEMAVGALTSDVAADTERLRLVPAGRMLDRERPGNAGGRLRTTARPLELRPPLRVVVLVSPAGQPRAGDHSAGLGERLRLTAEVGDEVDASETLIWIRGQASP
jgi:hypothetical protein